MLLGRRIVVNDVIKFGVMLLVCGTVVFISHLLDVSLQTVILGMFVIGMIVLVAGVFYDYPCAVAPIARHAVVEGMTDALMVLDLQNRIVDVNQAARQLIALHRPETTVPGVLFTEVFEHYSTLIAPHRTTYQPFDIEFTVGHVPKQRYFAASVAPIIVQDGSIRGRSVLLKDVTSLKESEVQLREQTQALELARRQAEEADQRKSQFLVVMSHELRTPLNAIINFNQFVSTGLYGTVTEKQADALNKSTKSARHLLALINDVLDLSKIQAGHMQLNIETNVDLRTEIETVISSVNTLLTDKPVTIQVHYSDNLPYIAIDRMRIRQVLLNLLTNAVKFTDAGSVTLHVEKTDNKLLVTVEDTGAGIAPEEQALIFEAFRQSKRNKNRDSGTGLGLPISQRLVQAHGGELWLDSSSDNGSRFCFSLPIQAYSDEEKG